VGCFAAHHLGATARQEPKKLLFIWIEPIRKSRSQNRQKFFASFFQKRRLSFAIKFECPSRQDKEDLSDEQAALRPVTGALALARRGMSMLDASARPKPFCRPDPLKRPTRAAQAVV
jgi:hypothetical protein